MLDEDEAAALAVVLEELAACQPEHPLSAAARQSAALLRQRVTAAGQRGRPIRSRHGDPEKRREAGAIRDDAADDRDTAAQQRDGRADERDDRGSERRRRADTADQASRSAEQRVRDLLRDAELRDQATAERSRTALPADHDALTQQWQVEREMAAADRVRNTEDREFMRGMLVQARMDRRGAARDRNDDAQDRLDGRRDRRAARENRQGAARDRQAAQADRDQSVIDGEGQSPSGADPPQRNLVGFNV